MQQKKSSFRAEKSSRPIARDISEAVSKMPPQALDLEEAVLGALMVERDGIKQVADYLDASHFFNEANREVYSAIIALYKNDDPIDMRTVVNQLRKNDKIDLVGGAVYIAELTSKVSSAANIDYHARIIIEMAVKRDLITIGGELHQLGYEESSDAIVLLEESYKKIKNLEEQTLKRSGPHRIKTLWNERLLTSLPDETPPIIWIEGTPVAWFGGHSLIVGAKKSRKTLFIVWLISQYIKLNKTKGDDVLFFDTEQSKRHVYRIREKVEKLTGKKIAVFHLRGMNPEERRAFVSDTIQYWPTPPALVINDGVRDMMNDINSTEEATLVATWLEKLTLAQREGQRYPPHIINVLHLNKSVETARGHIGTELQNKAECTIKLELDEKAGCTDVTCESSREKPFSKFSFTHNAEDLPELVNNASHEVVSSDDTKNRLFIIFEDGHLRYAEYLDLVKAQFGVSQNKAKILMATFARNGWVIKTGKDRDVNTRYKIMVSNDGTLHTPAPPADLFHDEPQGFDSGEDLPF